MILTALILNQLLFPGYKPVAVFHYTQPQGIVLQQAKPTVVATFKNEQPKPVATFKYVQPKGIPLTAPKITPVATWSF